jgi:hypothetical protein
VKEKYLDAAPTKFVGVDYKFTISKPWTQKDLSLQHW